MEVCDSHPVRISTFPSFTLNEAPTTLAKSKRDVNLTTTALRSRSLSRLCHLLHAGARLIVAAATIAITETKQANEFPTKHYVNLNAVEVPRCVQIPRSVIGRLTNTPMSL